MPTKQEIFDTVYDAIMDQKALSVSSNGMDGAYYSASGCRCSIGHLMSEEQAKALGEISLSVGKLVSEPLNSVPDWFHQNVDFLADLQDAHDMSIVCRDHTWDDQRFQFQYRMAKVATHHGLRSV